MKKQIVGIIILVILVAVGMFFAGRKFEIKKAAQVPQSLNQESIENSQQVNQNRPERLDTALGEVTDKEDGIVALKLRDGSSKKVTFSEGVIVKKIVEGQVSDMTVGQQISVTGEDKEDGTLDAKNVLIRAVGQNVQ